MTGPHAICRARSGALVRRRQKHGAASYACGGRLVKFIMEEEDVMWSQAFLDRRGLNFSL